MDSTSNQSMTVEAYADILSEIEEQPKWRHIADREMDYADGNQLDSDLLQRQKELGIPPAIEDLISPALLSIQGYEATIRTDWRVTPYDGDNGQDVADALNYKLNQAERKSRADRACSDAFRSQIACGIGWVEVARESDPFKFDYRCNFVHRNEIHWDFRANQSDLSDARWLRRQRWLQPERLAMVFPEHADVIREMGKHGGAWWDVSSLEGGSSTGLQNAWASGRAPTMQEEYWHNPTNKELCVSELWYRVWEQSPVIKTPDGRIVEFDVDNDRHVMAVASGLARVSKATIARVRRSYWIGTYLLFDGETPYPHRSFPYVPFFGFKEDATGIPYGYVRSMKYAQDSLNSGNSKLRWGMSVVRVERTKNAVAMSDAQFRRQIARPDADIVLDDNAMGKQGARFEVKRDYTLTDQHYRMLMDNRDAITRVSGVTAGFMGKQGNATSGLQEQTQVEQSNQALARVMDNFRDARSQIGELLLAMIIDDMGDSQQSVTIAGDAVSPARVVTLNAPEFDPDTGVTYLSNDLMRTRCKVSLEDVPSTNSYRGQQLNAMSEAIKSLPAEYQAAALPFMIALMDIPNKEKVIVAIEQAKQSLTPEQAEQQAQQAVSDALTKAGNDIKLREIEIKERRADSEIKNLDAKAVQIGVQAAFSAMQAGAQIASMPQIAPIADVVMQSAGYQRPAPYGDDPNYPIPQDVVVPADAADVRQNTSPNFPPVPQSAATGIETAATGDNLPT